MQICLWQLLPSQLRQWLPSYLCLTFFVSIVLIIPNHVVAQFCVKTMVLESAPSEGEITLKK